MKSIVAGVTLAIALAGAPLGTSSFADRIGDEDGNHADRILFCDVFPLFCRNR